MSNEEASRVIQALAHERRREIILILGSEGAKGVTELKKKLRMSTGSLYHNLSLLDGIVGRTPERKYILTKKGEELYVMLRDGVLTPTVIEKGRLGYLEPFLLPRWLFTFLMGFEPYSLLLNVFLLIIFMVSGYYSKLGLILIVPLRVGSSFMALLTSLTSYVVVVSTSTLIFGIRDPLHQLLGPALSLIPLIVYQVIYFIALGSVSSIASDTLGLVLMGYSALILSTSIKSSSNAKTEYCLLCAFTLVYLGSVFTSVLGNVLA
jgi:hypothetical protein